MSAGDEYFEDLLKFAIKYAGERNPAENVLYASCLGAHGATLDTLNGLAGELSTYWGDNIMPYVSAGLHLIEVLCSDWTDADGLTGSSVVDVAGGLSGADLPAQVASLVNFETNMRYRGGRGRMYLPQPDATKLTSDQLWDGTFVSDLTSELQSTFDDINELSIGDNLLTVVLYHREGNKVVAQGFEDVLGVQVSSVPGTQRRRVRRVGHIA
jgi:hypothetical protein